MTLTQARIYAYVFFEVPANFRTGSHVPMASHFQMSAFFEQWVNAYQLDHEETYDLNDPDLHMLRLAANDELSVCVFRFHDLDIVEIEWEQHTNELTVSDFWKHCTTELETQLSPLTSYSSCIGTARAYFAHTDDLSSALSSTDIKNISNDFRWKYFSEWTFSEISDSMNFSGNFYCVTPQCYLLLSHDTEPADFLGRDFPLIESFLQKLASEQAELHNIKALNEESEKQIQALSGVEKSENVEKNFPIIKRYQACFRQNTIRLDKLLETLDINLENLENNCKVYDLEYDMIFAPMLEDIRTTRRMLESDLRYARLTIEETESHLQLLELKIANQRLASQRRVENIFIAIMVGQIIIPTSEWGWDKKAGLMIVVLAGIYLITWGLGQWNGRGEG